MADKLINELGTKTALNLTDIFLVGDPSTGQSFKRTVGDLVTLLASSGNLSGSLTSGFVPVASGASTLVNSPIYVDASGNVGINRTGTLAYKYNVGITNNLSMVYTTISPFGFDWLQIIAKNTLSYATLTYRAYEFLWYDGNAVSTMGLFDGGELGVGSGPLGNKLSVGGDIYATGNITAFSDIRVKENICTIDKALDKVTNLRGVYYTRKDLEDKSRQLGFIAQEVNEIIPEAVKINTAGDYSVNYGIVTALLVEAIKDLKNEIDVLKSK
jgi:hypothetical protein